MARIANLFARKTPASDDAAQPAFGLKLALRKLWSDHVVWTRLYIMGAVAGTPDADAAAARLLKNQEDIGASIAPVYGAQAGKQLTGLLKEHILIAVELIGAAKAGNEKDFARHDKRWSDNAEQIAAFLSGANPHLPKKDLSNLLSLHLTLTKTEAVARMKEDWAGDVKAFDDIFTEILTMSDALADGIARQFPDRFGK